MMRVRLDAAQLEQFARDGFLTFETSLTAQQITLIRDTLARLHRRNAGFRQGALFDAMGLDTGGAMKLSPQMMQPHAFAPELLETDFFFLARGIAEQLVGAQARFRSDLSVMKPAYFGEATPWHQDEAFQDPAFAYRQVSFWLALQPTTESNSCMSCIPGSHLGAVLPHWFPGNDVRIHALDCADAVDPRQAVSCALPAGGCLILDQRTVHGAGPNVSARDSLGYILTFELAPTPVAAWPEGKPHPAPGPHPAADNPAVADRAPRVAVGRIGTAGAAVDRHGAPGFDRDGGTGIDRDGGRGLAGKGSGTERNSAALSA